MGICMVWGCICWSALCSASLFMFVCVYTHCSEMNCGMLGNEYVGICILGYVWGECRSLSASVLGCVLDMQV